MDLVLKYIVDVLLILVLVLSVVLTIRKGFIRCVFSLACVLVSVIAATSFNQPAAEWVYDNVLSDIVADKVETMIGENINNQIAIIDTESLISAVPEFAISALDKMGVEIQPVCENISMLQLSSEDAAHEIAEQIIRPGALILLRLICYLLIFIVARLLTGFIANVISKAARLPVLKQANKFLGAILGLAKGVAFVFALAIFLNLSSDIIKMDNVFVQAIENSNICAIIKDADFSALDISVINQK